MGAELDEILKSVPKEQQHGFASYMKWTRIDFDEESQDLKLIQWVILKTKQIIFFIQLKYIKIVCVL